MSDETKRNMLEWHKATVEWSLVGGDLPEWAASISGRDATSEDCIRLKREANMRMLYGNSGHRPVKGIIDFIQNQPPQDTTPITPEKWDEIVRDESYELPPYAPIYSRSMAAAMRRWAQLPRRKRYIPWRVRLKRCRRDLSLRHLWRKYDTVILFGKTGSWGINIEEYGE